jgi:SAM-dependent methyltransferase
VPADTQTPCKKTYSKSSAFYSEIKAEFFSANDALLHKAEAQNRLYQVQPLRLNCKLCRAPLPAPRDFTSHTIGYKFCTACGHLNGEHEETLDFVNALYSRDGGAEYAKGYLGPQYAARVRHIYQPKVDFLLENLERGTDLKVLDIGCGAGHFVYACLERGVRAEGLDLNESMVDFGNDQICSVFGAKPLCSAQEDEFFDRIAQSDADVISAIGVIEHFRQPDRFFEAFACSAARTVFFSVPMFSNSVIFETVFEQVFPRQLSGAHTHLFTEPSIRWMYDQRLVADRRVALRQRRHGSL